MKFEIYNDFNHVERHENSVRFYSHGELTAVIKNGILYYKKNKSPFFGVFCDKHEHLFSKKVQKRCVIKYV
jgi:hypothetical protein